MVLRLMSRDFPVGGKHSGLVPGCDGGNL